MNFKKVLVQSLLWRGLYFFTLLLVNVFLSRYLKAEGAGWVYYLSNIFSFSLIIISVCIEAGITYFASGKIIEPGKLVWFTLVWNFVVCLMVLLAVSIYIFFEPEAAAIPHNLYYYLGIFYLSGLFLTNCGTSLFYAENNFFLPNLLLTLWNVLLIIFIPKTQTAADLNAATATLTVYFLVFLLQGVSIIIAYVLKKKTFAFISLPTGAEAKKIFKYCSVVMLGNIVLFLVYRIDYLFVNISPVCTAADLGNYIQVSKLGQMLLIIPQIIGSVIFPRTASGLDRKELNTSLMIIARLFAQLYLIILLVVVFAGHWLFTWLFGETFNEMQLPFIILIPGIFCLSVVNLLSAYFAGKGKVGVNVKGAMLGLFVVVILDYFFVPVYGIIAAAAISTLGYAVHLAYPLYIFYKDYDIRLVDFFRWQRADYSWLKSLLANKKE
ncbi:MAG TPA: polysaccharide biosynthesis C-terminal domain-containing protein [Panacibacter sp.]|nr:polysaccharide biosynthesis C-terminal domain-containing protein [Panacibacter sp.]